MFKKIPWGPTLLFIVMFPVLLGLGFWQLQRLDQKEKYLYWRHSQSTLPPVDFKELTASGIPEDYEFRRVHLKGCALPDSYFLPSRSHPSKKALSGRYLVSPFLIEDTKEIIVVNWGWVPNHRDFLPPYHLKTIDVLIRLPEKIHLFTPVNTSTQRYNIIPQDFLADRFPAFCTVHESFYGQWIMERQENFFFPRALPVEVALSNRHLEYAITWFSFAFTFAIIYGIYLRRYRKT